MDLEQEIERIRRKYNYMIFGEVARQDFSKALREMDAFTRKQTLEEVNNEVMDSKSLKSNRGLRLWLDSKMRGLQKGEEQPCE